MKKPSQPYPKTDNGNNREEELNSYGSANAFTNTEEPLDEVPKELSDEELDKLLSSKTAKNND